MTENPFEAFVALAQSDAAIIKHKKQQLAIDQEIQNLVKQKESLIKQREDAKNALHTLRKEVDKQERALKETDQTIAQKNRRLQEVNSPKEYASVQQELEKLHQQKNEGDEALLALWQNYEELQKKGVDQEKNTGQQLQQQIEHVAAREQQLISIKHDIENIQAQRASREQTVPAEWLEKYRRMQQRIENPVVPVTNGNCSACFYQVSQQDLMSLSRHKILECKNCFRLLYII